MRSSDLTYVYAQLAVNKKSVRLHPVGHYPCMFAAVKVWLVAIGTLLSMFGYTQNIRVGLYYVSTVKSAEVVYDTGRYLLVGDSVVYDTLDVGFKFTTYTYGDQIKAKVDGKEIGVFDTVKLIGLDSLNGFKIRSLTHNSKYRYYWQDLEFSKGDDKLKIVNVVDIEAYLPGVIESESGTGEGIEYYKIQATISRTYAHSHTHRHKEEGFHVCDHTHCQVYRKRSRKNPAIPAAVKATTGLVIVDSDINLITASFFSNCGGQTCNSEDVWSGRLDYLRSVKDPFCREMPHYYWKKIVSRDRWLRYVENKMPAYYKANHTFSDTFDISFKQGKRRVYYSNAGYSIPLKDIRADFELRSTFFSITEDGNDVVFKGRGFGHGVGLCQEGAMRMADLGYSYLEILKFYYSGIHVIHLEDMDFFRLE